MHSFTATVLPPPPAARPRVRSALLASSDRNFLERLRQTLTGLRWQVREVASGAEAWAVAQTWLPEAAIVDSWLPDLDLNEFLHDFRASFPQMDILTAVSAQSDSGPRSPHRQELLYALRSSQETDTAAWNVAPGQIDTSSLDTTSVLSPSAVSEMCSSALIDADPPELFGPRSQTRQVLSAGISEGEEAGVAPSRMPFLADRLPEFIGNHPRMIEVSRRIRLVAPRSTPVLIEGPTGSGKEIVAEALHRLSPRSRKPFVAINCAAIPEDLLEAELFGHTRGAFTGAVHGRVGRIESADGGTLFLDEIGEMPLSLQSKLLRFFESGELQRVGDNETIKVDVRLVAATHRPLAKLALEGSFRADLYYRLAVFLIRTPALIEHIQDLPLLVDHILQKLGRDEPVKNVDAACMAKLAGHSWAGNVRELQHVLERAAILAGESTHITTNDIDFGMTLN